MVGEKSPNKERYRAIVTVVYAREIKFPTREEMEVQVTPFQSPACSVGGPQVARPLKKSTTQLAALLL